MKKEIIHTEEETFIKTPEQSHDVLGNARREQPDFSRAWIGAQTRRPLVQRFGFGLLSLTFIVIAGNTLRLSYTMLYDGSIFMPLFSLFWLVIGFFGLTRAIRG